MVDLSFVPGEPETPEQQRLDKLLRYHLTTAEILYHMPDHPRLLQSYIWQEYDLAPKFPALNRFLGFWESQLDGKLHSVRVVSARLVSPAEYRAAAASYDLH
ncbi:MAG TPA: Usg family protein [Ferrovibrio sp.]|uniref:usg protein n=1 Tax=Ferrovibrio sp. TaxID=1917215 RepID=UPI002B4B5589|nr:Usg family protein [Ferrovibrio sp.]HLT76254.1 Usg family protein [Ferrovibrio sp.]